VLSFDGPPVSPPTRDRVKALSGEPTIVSVSDIHGFLEPARSALLTLSDHPDYAPLVETDAARRLHWVGGEEYVLVFNGDLVDRGPDSERVLEMVARLASEAPHGHVRVTVGNHELAVLTPELYGWSRWYSGQRSEAERQAFMQAILDGHVIAAYEGYRVTYAHAGRNEAYDVREVNDELVDGASVLLDGLDEPDALERQTWVVDSHRRVLGYGGETGRGPDAGIAWLDFEFLSRDAPPQVVGHTRQDEPLRRGAVVCQNVIRNTRRSDGGEAVVVETPATLAALRRTPGGGVEEHAFSLPE